MTEPLTSHVSGAVPCDAYFADAADLRVAEFIVACILALLLCRAIPHDRGQRAEGEEGVGADSAIHVIGDK